MRCASCAVIGSPVSRISIAIAQGIWRTSRTVEPPIGNRLRFTSEIARRASSATIRMSVACRISVPPA